MGKYPKFKVVDPYNTQMEKKNQTVKIFSRSQNTSMELLAAGHTQILFLLIHLAFSDEPHYCCFEFVKCKPCGSPYSAQS